MNTFKKKSLNAALAGLTVVGAVGAAQAVNVNPDGLGQVLLYPYYTTRADKAGNTYSTLINVVNSTQSTKAVKIRFIEGKNSKEVLDFNLFLSPFDVWSANVVPNTTTGGAGIVTDDQSCTSPKIPSAATATAPTRKAKDFVNYQYTGSFADGADTSLDRTREGYVEIIEMATYDPSTATYDETLHDATGKPTCAGSVLDSTTPQVEGDAPSGGLFGSTTLINVFSGTDYAVDAVALDNFSGAQLYSAGSDLLPTLSNVTPKTSVVIASNSVIQSTWTGNAVNPVSAVLMHDQVLNEFVVDKAIGAVTDWVITFPTKRFYVVRGTGAAAGGLFQRNFDGNNGSCDDISLNIWDREEQTTSSPLDFSPLPPQGSSALCWEANVLTFAGTNALGSKNDASKQNVPTSFGAGWLNLGFFPATVTGSVHKLGNSATTVTPIGNAPGAAGTYTYYGLPLIGFAAIGYQYGALPVAGGTALSNYGGAFSHKVTKKIAQQ
jgi:hypothetical protein